MSHLETGVYDRQYTFTAPEYVFGQSIADRLWREDGMLSPSRQSVSGDLIAEWTDGPIRTVTFKEVVPGVYGKLTVHQCGDYSITPCTVSDLRAVIATLTEIADAMDSD